MPTPLTDTPQPRGRLEKPTLIYPFEAPPEPGRVLSAPAMFSVSTVIGRARRTGQPLPAEAVLAFYGDKATA